MLINPNHCEAITEAMLLLENNGDIYKRNWLKMGIREQNYFLGINQLKGLIEIYEEMMM